MKPGDHEPPKGVPSDPRKRSEVEAEPPIESMSMGELLALRKPPYRSIEEIVETIRRDRDAWDD